MASRRLAPRLSGLSTPAVPATRAVAHSFTTTTTTAASQSSKAPALSDIEPDRGPAFDEKQKQFRTNLAELNRKRKEQERQSASIASAAKSSSSATASSVSSASYPLEGHGLSSLSTATGEAARKKDEATRKIPKGPFSNLIYGTEEGREMDRDIERSFSQLLARGKYVHSIVFHHVKPDKVDEYVELVGEWYPRMASMPENKVHLVGSWRTEVGDCDTFGACWLIHGIYLVQSFG